MRFCFLPCFSPSKRQNHFSSSEPLNNANDIIHQNPVLEESIHWISSESKEKVTPTKQNHEQDECSDSLFSVSIGRGKPVSAQENAAETEVTSTPMQLHPSVPEPKQKSTEGKDEKEEDRKVDQSLLEYRYRECYDNDGNHDINLDDDDDGDDDGDDDDFLNEKTEKGSSESSLFSLSTDFSDRKKVSFSSTEKVDNEVSSKMVALQEDDDEVLSVLNPIENVSCQGKVKALNPINKDKENNYRIEEETSLKVSSISKRKMKEEIGVDTSLSDWLVESENKENIGKRCDVEDRPILRTLRVEEIRKYSSVSKTCSKSDKCVKDRKQDWSSATIKTRQEPALEGSVEN